MYVLSAEYLGFNNRTCTSSLVPTKTAGPVMRGPSSSMMWREWMVTVKNKGDDRVDVSLQSFVHPARKDQGKCLGYVSNYYGNPRFKGSCLIPPYGNGLFLNGTEDTASKASNSPQVLSMKAAGEGEFEITAANKPDECTRALAVEDCDNRAVLVEDPVKYFTDSRKYTTWVLTKRYDVVASGASAPAPAPSPTPAAVAPSPGPPPPPAPIPGPRIEPYQDGQTVVTWGYIELVVDSFGGNNRCSVTTVVITVTNQASTPATYEIPASRSGLSSVGLPIPVQVGENSISAVGMCRNGESTERSQALSVSYYPVSSPPLSGVRWTIRSSAADNSWVSVTWGGPAGSETFVAVADSGTGNRVMTSPDGVRWTIRSSAADNFWFSVTWGGPAGLFVAVAYSGTGNRVMTSPDGVTWTSRSSAADNVWTSVTWGGPAGSETFVAVASSGTGNRVMTSPDGVTWTLQTSAADNDWRSVTWGGPAGSEKFVAVAYSGTGTGNRVMTSP